MIPSFPDEETLFTEALALPLAARAAFLDRACGENRELRARLAVLLAAHETPEATLGSPAERPPPEPEETPGMRIGRYKLLQKIGEGGCGIVYMADQLEPVHRRVALKIIKLGMDTREVITRFEAERQALALMDHPNIAHVLDAGATDTGRPYFVMELVRGVPITRFCDEQVASTAQRLELFIQVCHAVQHAHQKGIIHRDLKPSNILVTVNDGVPVPKVIDFGIAKATQGRLTDKTVFTAFEQFVGTPAYMSPEQAVMTSLDVDTRSDIYSLGVLLYELLTGRTPFDAKELAQAGLDEIRRRIREMDPPRPSARLSTMEGNFLTLTARHRQTEPPKLINLVRGDLDWIVMRCLEKDRARRYGTANGLADDIQRHLTHRPVTASPPSVVYRFRKRVRRHRVAFAAATAVTLALILGLMGSIWQAARAKRAEHEQSRLRLQAQASAYAAEMNLAQEAYTDQRVARAISLLKKHIPEQEGAKDFRGFEWRYLWRLCHEGDALFTFALEGDWVTAIAFADGGRVVTCSAQGRVRTFDQAERREVARIELQDEEHTLPSPSDLMAATALVDMPTNEVRQRIAVSGNGEVVAAAFTNGAVRLWRMTGEKQMLTVPNEAKALGVALSAHGTTLTVLEQGRFSIWDCSQRHAVDVHRWDNVRGIPAISNDGRMMAAAAKGFGARVMSIPERSELPPLERRHSGIVCALAFSPDSRTLATSGWDSSIKLTDLPSGKIVGALPGNTIIAWHLTYSPDGQTLASAGDGEAITLWEVSDRSNARLKRTLRGHRGNVTALAFSSDGARLASASTDGTVKVWSIADTAPDVLRGHTDWAYSVAFSPDGRTLASGSYDGTIRLWSLQSTAAVATIKVAPSDIFTVAFTPDGKCVAGCEGRWVGEPSKDPRKVKLWSVADQKEVAAMDRDGSLPRTLDISPDGRILASGDWEEARVKFWAIPAGREIASFRAHDTWLNTVRFSADGRFLATTKFRGEVKLWDTATRHEIARYDFENESYGPNVDFSPDSKILAIGRYELELWSTKDRQLLARLDGHKAPIMSVRFSPDGRTVATGSVDHTIKLWNLAVRQEVATLRGHSGPVSGLAFSVDGTILASSSEDRSIRLWRAVTAAEQRR